MMRRSILQNILFICCCLVALFACSPANTPESVSSPLPSEIPEVSGSAGPTALPEVLESSQPKPSVKPQSQVSPKSPEIVPVAVKVDTFPVSLFVGDEPISLSGGMILSDDSIQDGGLVFKSDKTSVAKIQGDKLYPVATGSAKITFQSQEHPELLQDVYIRVRPADEKNVVVGVAPEDGDSLVNTGSSYTSGGTSTGTLSNGGLSSLANLVGKLTDLESQGDNLFVADSTLNVVHVVSIKTGQKVKEIPVSSAPVDLALNLSGSRLYVSSNGSASVDEIDTSTLEKLRTLAVSEKVFRVAADASTLYVSYDDYSSSIEAYSLETGSLITTFPNTVSGRSFILLSKDNQTLYVLERYYGDFHKIDVSSATPTVLLSEDSDFYSDDDDMVFNHDESEILLPSYYSATDGIQAIRTSDLKPAGLYSLDTYDANSVDVSPDGKYVLATHYENKVVIFNRSTRAELNRVTSGHTIYRHFKKVHLAADGQTIFGFIEASNYAYQEVQLVNPGRLDKIKLE